MLPVIGTVHNAVKLAKLDREWQQKKEKEEKKKLVEMTPQERELHRYQEDLAKMRESNQMSGIDAKVKSGADLSPEELKYLKEKKPEAYREYQELKQEQEAYKEKLKSCRTKDEVDELKFTKLGEFMSSAKKISSNPNIPKAKKLALMEKLLKRAAGIEKIHIEFTKTVQYQELPTEEELTEKVTKKALFDAVQQEEPVDIKQQEVESEPDSDAEMGEDLNIVLKPEPKKENKETKDLKIDFKADFDEVYSFLKDYLTKDRPIGYGLEYQMER